MTDVELNEKYARLFRLAKDALQAENELLQARFTEATKNNLGRYADVAHGLTYWLFEANLVYAIFKQWLAEVPVAWEHATGEHRLSCVAAKGSYAKCDLVVFPDWTTKTPEAAIEAKWWNDNSSKLTGAILADVTKLQRNYPGPVRRYLLTFWWGTLATRDDDFKDANSFCHKHGLEIACNLESSYFDTKLRTGELGYFAVVGIRCP